jgi:hypothetical protein
MVRKTLWLAGVGLLCVLAGAACGDSKSSSSTPTAPSPAPAPTPTPPPAPPEPPPPPMPPPPPAVTELSSIVLSEGSVPGQSRPTATITLTAPAPSGGAVVRLESSNRDVARVPASVTVAAGATTTTFSVDTATVPTRSTITITAAYAGLERTAALTVTLPTPRASFTVTSPDRGADACVLIDGGLQLDCRLDGRGSDGVLVRWSWVLRAVERIVQSRPDPIFAEIDTGGCKFVNNASTNGDGENRWTNLTITLEVQDRDGSQSPALTRTVRLYVNGNCGW